MCLTANPYNEDVNSLIVNDTHWKDYHADMLCTGLRLVWTMEFFMFIIFEISWFLIARGSVLQV